MKNFGDREFEIQTKKNKELWRDRAFILRTSLDKEKSRRKKKIFPKNIKFFSYNSQLKF